jgi:heterodisulfide reductase subunit B
MTQIGPETAFELIHRLISSASEHRADLMATVCPMCQMNIDAYQGETNRYFGTHLKMPIVFFTQLMALAFGFPADQVGFGAELVSTRTALGQIGIEVPKPTEAEPRRRKPEGLPMPTRRLKVASKSNGKRQEVHQ